MFVALFFSQWLHSPALMEPKSSDSHGNPLGSRPGNRDSRTSGTKNHRKSDLPGKLSHVQKPVIKAKAGPTTVKSKKTDPEESLCDFGRHARIERQVP